MTLETSIGQAAGPSLLFCSNLSRKCLSSFQNLKRKEKPMKTKGRESHKTSPPLRGRRSSIIPSFLPLTPSVYIKPPPLQAVVEIQTPIYHHRLVFGPEWPGRAPLARLTSNLHSEVLGHHAVPGSQISVDKLVGIKVWHAIGDLPRHLDHLFEWGQGLAGGVL